MNAHDNSAAFPAPHSCPEGGIDHRAVYTQELRRADLECYSECSASAGWLPGGVCRPCWFCWQQDCPPPQAHRPTAMHGYNDSSPLPSIAMPTVRGAPFWSWHAVRAGQCSRQLFLRCTKDPRWRPKFRSVNVEKIFRLEFPFFPCGNIARENTGKQ